jgi:hypothetical protein
VPSSLSHMLNGGRVQMEDIRCQLCGCLPDHDPEFAMRAFQHRAAEKEGRIRGPLVYICPVCAGRTRYEAEKERKLR